MFNYFYINVDAKLFRIYCKLGITENPRVRLADYNTHQYRRYILLVKYNVDKIAIFELERLCLDATIKYRDETYGCSIEGRYGPIEEIVNICKTVINTWRIKGEYIEYDEHDYIMNDDAARNDFNYKREIKHLLDRIYKSDTDNLIITPTTYQHEILSIIEKFYTYEDKGKLIWACGLGKTIMSLLIVRELSFKQILIGVPGLLLMRQFKNEVLKVFPNPKNILLVCSEKDDDAMNTTSAYDIIQFINNRKNNPNPLFVITTYSSCPQVLDAGISFDFKIGDEAHHLTHAISQNITTFNKFHKIPATKALFMTATEKFYKDDIKTIKTEDVWQASMDDEKLFGKYIDVKDFNWALKEKRITNYGIVIFTSDDLKINKEFNRIISGEVSETNLSLFVAAFMSLAAMIKYPDLTHQLIYTNKIEDADLVEKYVHEILRSDSEKYKNISDGLFVRSMHSKMCSRQKEFDGYIKQFKESPRGIIPCVNIFGEGFDMRELNGVAIAANIESPIRLFQYLLRPFRLDPNKPDKEAKILLPNFNTSSFENLRQIWKDFKKDPDALNKVKFLDMDDNYNIKNDIVCDYERVKNLDVELTYFNIFKTRENIKAIYDYACVQNKHLQLNTVAKYLNHIEKYKSLGDLNAEHTKYALRPKEYFSSVWTNWYDYLGVDTSQFIRDKDKWKEACAKYEIYTVEKYHSMCSQYKELMPDPGHWFTDFGNLNEELPENKNKKIYSRFKAK